MKKTIRTFRQALVALSAIAFFGFGLAACPNPAGGNGNNGGSFTASFDADGGDTAPPNQTVDLNDTATRPYPAPQRMGYNLLGWFEGDYAFNFDTPVTRNINLTARWTTDFVVTFDADGGLPMPQPQSVPPNGTATEPYPVPERTGLNFYGWFQEGADTAFVFTTQITQNITLTARWVVPVSFDTQSGSYVPAQNVAPGQTAARPDPAPTRYGYRLIDWYTAPQGGAFFNFDAPITANTTVYARWLPISNVTHYLGANNVPMKMTNIPRGRFIMGGETGRDNATPAHQVTLTRGFYMGVVPVTQAMWVEIMGATSNPSWFAIHAAEAVLADRPVEFMTWYDAVYFANALSRQQGLTPVYTITDLTWEQHPHNDDYEYTLTIYRDDWWWRVSATVTANWNANGFRLPTSAEWERAARSGTTTRWSFGDDQEQLATYAWFGQSDPYDTSDVGSSRSPNPWGLYDMHGNVWDWTWDLFEDYSAGAVVDPRSVGTTGTGLGQVGWFTTRRTPDYNTYRVIRGGGLTSQANDTHSAARYQWHSLSSDGTIGLRLVRNAE
jgi:uncharacterized repeat protein (TIGR02543 family)